ncbi:MAG: hypothetical protein WCP12_16490 [bacterium]
MNISTKLIFVCLLSVVQAAYAGMNDKTLKEYLNRNFNADESMEWGKRAEFKVSRAISDEQLHRVLMEIYNEASEKRSFLTPKSVEWNKNRRAVAGVLGWLPVCGDIPVKEFLMDYAVEKKNDVLNRSDALLSYLRIADAEESKNALLRFLVEGDRMDCQSRSSICEDARTVFMDAPSMKKIAILEALYASLAKEDNKWLFRVYDNILCEMSKGYANSRQRHDILQRLIKAPSLCKADDYAMPELQEKLKVLQKTRLSANISTNLAALKAKNLNLPQPDLATNKVIAVEDNAVANEKTVSGVRRSLGVYVLLGIPALLLLGFGAWKLTRK